MSRSAILDCSSAKIWLHLDLRITGFHRSLYVDRIDSVQAGLRVQRDLSRSASTIGKPQLLGPGVGGSWRVDNFRMGGLIEIR